METLIWVGFSQSLFVALLMVAKRTNSTADKILSAWLFLLAIEFLTCALDYRIFGFPLLSSSFLLFNPALYLYIRSLTFKEFRLKRIQLLHLLPFLLFEVFAYIVREPVSLETFFHTDPKLTFRLLFAIATIVSWSIYNPLSIWMVIRHRRNLVNEFSTIDSSRNLAWINFISLFYLSYCFTAFFIGTFGLIVPMNPDSPHIYNYSVLLALIYITGFYGLRQRDIFRKSEPEEKTIAYKYSILNEKKKAEIREKILLCFEKDKPYLNPDLNMETLSASLKIPRYQLTEVLNTEIGKNFFQFVNSYRIDSVKKMLSDPANRYSIEAIGYECGFNSKSSFFTVFRTLTGLTPLQFKNQQIKG